MPDFAYTARNMQGAKVSGTLSAGSEREVAALLSSQSLFPVSVTQAKSATSGMMGAKRVRGQLMAVTYSQLASLLRSGVPLLRSLAVLREQSSHPVLKEVLSDIHSRVEDGTPFGEALARYPGTFSEMAVNMVRAGAEGGFLEDALERVAQFTEQQEDLKGRTMGALAYPVFLGTVGTAVVSGLMIFFVPKFASLFENLRQRGELPALTEWLLWLSDTIRGWGWLVAIVAAFGILWIRSWIQTDEGAQWSARIRLRLPMIGRIYQNLAVARFCRVLGTLLKNGVPILKSLEISREAAGNRILSQAIAKASENISAGQSLAGPLANCGYFPRTVVEMIAVAEESNSLDKVLVEIADGLEKRTFRQLDLFVRLLEPIMLLVLAVVVLLVVIALLLPVIKMSSTV
ncbi:MAG TPA: type II secretion system F family protein [Pirellulaceae bacterium]|nr:type II secretion system F family protein [Pirellulaceae bacterium]